MKTLSDLGTNEIHKRKSVMIEGGTMPRARVMNQNMIDQYLCDGLLTMAQHAAGEYLLIRAAQAGYFPSAPPPDKVGTTGTKDFVPAGLESFADCIRIVVKRFGEYAGYITTEVVLHDYDVRGDSKKYDILCAALTHISERRMTLSRPARHLKRHTDTVA